MSKDTLEAEEAMTDAWGNLHDEVRNGHIIITMPGTPYTVTYYKPPNSPQLLAKNFPRKDDTPNDTRGVPRAGVEARQR